MFCCDNGMYTPDEFRIRTVSKVDGTFGAYELSLFARCPVVMIEMHASYELNIQTVRKVNGLLQLTVRNSATVLDMGAIVLDIGVTVLEMGGTVLDMGATVLDMGATVLDMGATVLDMGITALDIGANLHQQVMS